MSIPCKRERSLLSHDEYEIVRSSHHPAIYELEERQLAELGGRLRTLRDKERTQARQKQREVRGKADARGKSFPGLAEHAVERKQVFANAVKRVNKESHRLRALEARSDLMDSAQRALAMRRAAYRAHHPDTGDTPRTGMRVARGRRRRRRIAGRQIGIASAATKRAQARKDSRPGM